MVLFFGICWSKSQWWSIMVARDLMKVRIICLMFFRAKGHLKCNNQFFWYNFQVVFYLCPTLQFWPWWYNPQVFLFVILLLPKGPRDATKLWPSCNTHQEDLPWCNKTVTGIKDQMKVLTQSARYRKQLAWILLGNSSASARWIGPQQMICYIEQSEHDTNSMIIIMYKMIIMWCKHFSSCALAKNGDKITTFF